MNELEMIDAVPAPPARPAESHKGTFGTVTVVGGSGAMIGAPAIAARAALRAGAGLVRIAASPAVLPCALMIEPSATGVELRGPAEEQLAILDRHDAGRGSVLAVGPGMGAGDEHSVRLVRALLSGQRSVVLDADGLNLLAAWGKARASGGAPLVMTPHPGEYRRLAQPLGIRHDPTDASQRPPAAAELARLHDAVVVLKGRHTIVSDGSKCYRNQTGNPALATAGSGDVLTGLIAALIGQGMTPFDAAVLGVHAHGLAADRWARRCGTSGLLARELADELAPTLAELRERHD